jgi:hypothetical protein
VMLKPVTAVNQPAQSAPSPEKPTQASNSPIAPARVADRHETESEPRRTASLFSDTHPVAHAKPAERHSHRHSGHEIRPLSVSGTAHSAVLRHPERFNRAARSSAPQLPDQAAAFGQLLQHLTGSTERAGHPSAGALSPPGPGAPDPFAPRPAVESSNQ